MSIFFQTSALTGRPNSSAYGASKYATDGFTKSLRLETSPNIQVLSIYPGGMKTNFFDEQIPNDFNQYMDPSYVAQKIIANMKQEKPAEEPMIKRP